MIMYDRRQVLIEVFEDTQRFCTETPKLAVAIEASKKGTRYYGEDDYPALPEKRKAQATIVVTRNTSFQAATDRYFHHDREHIAVLNFASAVNPGGGVKKGSSAQEESLCRCSTLFPTLEQHFIWEKYYKPNREANNPLHTDACIWSPDVVICKTDSGIPQRMAPERWATVDIISCAAPNLRQRTGNAYNPEMAMPVRLTHDEQYTLHLKRAKHIMHLAASRHVDALILGAFGCGAFANDPWAVAEAYRDAISEYSQYFVYIEFAVYCRSNETENYDAFKSVIGR